MPASNQQTVSIIEMERAINHWRGLYPSTRDTMTLCPQAACLAELYARMIIFKTQEISIAEFSSKAKKALREAKTA